jgi:hypothetical protein
LRARVAFLVLPLVLAAAARADDAGGVTVMDPVFVEAASRDPWMYFRVDGFEVLSRCPEDFNRAFARGLEQSTAARLAMLPPRFWADLPTPMKMILYDRPPQSREGFDRGNPTDLSWSVGGLSSGNATIRYSHPVTIGDGDTFICCGNYWDVQSGVESLGTDPDSDIRLRERTPTLPPWFVAGFGGRHGVYRGHFMRAGALSEYVVLPPLTWVSTDETLGLRAAEARRRKGERAPRPGQFLGAGRLLGPGPGDAGRDLWESECALLVRWGLLASGDRGGFLRFVDRAAGEPPTEALLRECMGLSYPELEADLLAYLPAAIGAEAEVRFRVKDAGRPEVREATSAEVARIVGDWGRLEGRSMGADDDPSAFIDYEFRHQCMDEADKLFSRAARRRSADPLLLSSYGLYEAQAGDSVRAQAALGAAVAVGVVRPRAYVELARLRLDDALPSIQEGFGDLGQRDFDEIEALLTTARFQMPGLHATYDLLVRVLGHAPTRPGPEQLAPLEKALQLFPRDPDLANQVADLYGRLGDPARAKRIRERLAGLAGAPG